MKQLKYAIYLALLIMVAAQVNSCGGGGGSGDGGNTDGGDSTDDPIVPQTRQFTLSLTDIVVKRRSEEGVLVSVDNVSAIDTEFSYTGN